MTDEERYAEAIARFGNYVCEGQMSFLDQIPAPPEPPVHKCAEFEYEGDMIEGQISLFDYFKE